MTRRLLLTLTLCLALAGSALAALKVTNLSGLGIVSDAGITINQTDSASSGSNLNNYTFASESLGPTVSGTRRIVVVSGVNTIVSGTQSLSSATIGGVTATIHAQQHHVDQGVHVAIISALVPTGTAGDVVVNYSLQNSSAHIVVYALTADDTISVDDTATDTADPVDLLIDVEAGGAILGGCYQEESATLTWTGLNDPVDVTVGSRNLVAAQFSATAAELNRVLQCDATSTGSLTAMAGAAVSFQTP